MEKAKAGRKSGAADRARDVSLSAEAALVVPDLPVGQNDAPEEFCE